MWVGAVLEAIAKILSIIELKEKRKYQDEYLSIQSAIFQEQNKTPELRSDAVLDSYEFRLRILLSAITADLGK